MPEAAPIPVNVITPSPGFMGAGAAIGFAADPIERLPAAARARLIDLRNRRDDMRAALMQTSQRFSDAQGAMRDISRRAELLGSRLSVAKYDSRYQPADRGETHPALSLLNEEALRCRAELNHAKARSDELSAEWQELARLVDAIESYLGAAAEPIAEHSEGEGLSIVGFSTVDGIRTKVAAIKDQIARTKGAPISKGEARARMKAQVSALAAAGQPDVTSLIAHGEPVRFASTRAVTQPPVLQLVPPDQHPSAIVAAAAGAQARTGDAVGLMAYLFQDQLVAALDKQIAEGNFTGAMTAGDRAAALDKLKIELLAMERSEAQTCELEHIALRSDIDVRAALGVDGPEPAP